MNKSDKLYRKIDEQLKILERRKITIGNRNFAKKVLFYENYYYVINGYKTPFISSTNPEDCYKPGTSFHEIVSMYSFDRKLREIFFPNLLRIEHCIKSVIIDVFSSRHGYDHTSYLRPESFNSIDFINFKRTNALIFDLLKLIDREKHRHNAIAHYMNDYGYVPLWVLTKVMTFGKINSFYACMKKDEKEEVASRFNIMGPLSRPRSKILRVAVSRIILSSEASKVKLVGNLVA